MVDTEIRGIISRFVNTLTTKGIKVEKIIVFGSHSSGKIHKDSDIDVAVVSSDFGRDKYEERKLLLQLAWKIDPRLEPIPVSADAFVNDTWIPLIYEIRQKGLEITV
jgi:predicted nucleotidyltransferase